MPHSSFPYRFKRIHKTKLTVMLIMMLGLGISSANAQTNCPELNGKTIRWIVPYSAGGGFDAYSRLIAPYFARQLGARVRVDNLPGGGGMLGTKTIMGSPADGLTVGLINTPGILATMVSGLRDAPNPAKQFTIIGRMSDKSDVIAVKADAAIKNMDDVFLLAKKRPVLLGITDVGSSVFLNSIVTASLLNLKAEYVAGYPGTRQTTMALLRGEVDLAAAPFSTILDRISSGELRVILQISSKPVADHPALNGVPVLGGPQGLAARRARQLGRDAAEATADADALAAMSQSGRLVVAPAGLDSKMIKCLQNGLMASMADTEFIEAARKAKRPIQPMDAREALGVVEMAAGKAAKLAPIVKKAIEQVRK